jgi:effector-associated domain 1 (EAD1)-containing protein
MNRFGIVQMPGHARKGKMRSTLREAILAGFNPGALDEVLTDNDMLRPNIAIGPDFATRVNSLIDVARQEGWLIELCGVLAAARSGNDAVRSKIVAVQKWLIEQRNSDEIDLQFEQGPGLLSKPRLLSVAIATVTLIGIAAWIFAETKPSISTSGPQSPVVSGTKGNVQINIGPSAPPTAPK